ncbi:CHASE domain-containing protein [Paraglaciecola sp. 20A4]|uniref:CHASE domain-containing protein n=1 Tax=Paraglaciecola sp. 20A4 TaxID=2687288 RepID=UPI00140BF338|nr:CHASE domain-containing protein [Paraglaciecola sp. 20A4]
MKPSWLPNRRLKQSILKWLLLPIIIMLIGILLSVSAEYSAQQKQANLIKQTLQRDLLKIKSDFNERIKFYSYGLTGLHGLITTIGLDNFDFQTMTRYAQNRNFQEEFPGLRGLGFIQKVEQDDLAKFLNTQRQMRPDKLFNLRQLSPHNDSLFIIRYIEPELNNKSAIGLDVGSEKMRRNAAINSARNNELQITAPITLVQANEKAKQGFLILMPVYDVALIPDDPASRLRHLLGWTYAPVLIDEVINSNSEFPRDVNLSIMDVTEPHSENIFYQHQSQNSIDSTLTYSEKVPIFGRHWSFSISAQPAYIQRVKKSQDYATFFQYLIFTIVVALLSFSVLLIIVRKQELQRHQQELQLAKEKTLIDTNDQLEELVKRRTKEISNANALQNAILENANYSVIATDTKGLITLFNPAAELLLGYKSEDLIQKETPALFHLESEVLERSLSLTKELNCEFTQSVDVFFAKSNRGITDNSDWTYVSKSGEKIPVRLNLTALRNELNEIIGYLGIAYDLSEQIEKENALARAKESAEKANVAKSEFLANMSHEIRTPLNGIFGTLQLLRDETAQEKVAQYINLATQSTATLNELVNDILDVSKLEVGKLDLHNTPVDLTALLTVIESELTASIQKKSLKFTIHTDLTQSIWMADELRLKQILLNILTNAIKFTHSGEIHLSISNHRDGGVFIVVKDSGIGMNKEAQERLFQRFEQADQSITRQYGGTGLGMSIVLSLVTLMKGKINVSSKENVGTIVKISLPLMAIDSNDSVKEIKVTPEESLNVKTILIAEDNDINQIIINSMLEKSYTDIHIVENGQLAADFAIKNHVDLVLMDIQMPVMDGVEACKLIKLCKPNLPIIAITANIYAEDLALYKDAGFNATVAKPFDKGNLLANITKMLKDHS